MKHSNTFTAVFLFFLIPGLLLAQVPEGGTMINTQSGTTWQKIGRCTITSQVVLDQEFSSALRVEVGSDVSNAWDAQVKFPAAGGVTENDVVLVAFWGRTISSLEETGEGSLNVVIEHNVSYSKQLSTNISIGGEWKEYYAPAQMTTTWVQSEISLLFHIGFPSQTVEVANVRFLNYQNSLGLEDMPVTPITYNGQDPDADWRAPAEERISQIRKGAVDIRVVDENGDILEGASVKVEMLKHQFGFGTAVAASELINNETYRNRVLDDFNEVVFENDLKWPQFQNSSTHLRIKRAMDTLDAHGIAIRGHNIIWPSYRFTPDIVETLKDDPENLRKVIDAHIDEVTSFTKGRLNDWDVMNEPYTEHDIQDILGDEVMADWFKRTRRNDRAVKLYINDYSILSGGGNNTVKQDYYYNVIQFIEELGGEIDGIGMQGHFGTEFTSINKVFNIIDRFAELDKEIKITEFDISTVQEDVKVDYTRDFMTIVFSHPSVKSIMVWGFWENRHWKPDAAFFNSDWSIRPQGEVWNEMIKEQWWTQAVDSVTDAAGTCSFEGFLGSYAYTVIVGDQERKGTFRMDNSHQSGLANSILISMDEALPGQVEITSSIKGFACAGEEVMLHVSVGEGVSCEWSLNEDVLDDTNDTIIVSGAGTYQVSISKNGVSLNSEPFVLEVRELPGEVLMVDGDLEFCQGGSVGLSVYSESGSEYEWYRDGSRVLWGDTLLETDLPGSYSLFISSDDCRAEIGSHNVIVNQNPDASIQVEGDATFCAGEFVSLEASYAANTIYSWSKGDQVLEETSPILLVRETGSYTLTVSNDKCSTTSIPVEVTVLHENDAACAVGIEEEILGVRVFPNPFRESLKLEFLVRPEVETTIEAFDAMGKLVFKKQMEPAASKMSLSFEDPGLYLLRISRGELVQVHRIIML